MNNYYIIYRPVILLFIIKFFIACVIGIWFYGNSSYELAVAYEKQNYIDGIAAEITYSNIIYSVGYSLLDFLLLFCWALFVLNNLKLSNNKLCPKQNNSFNAFLMAICLSLKIFIILIYAWILLNCFSKVNWAWISCQEATMHANRLFSQYCGYGIIYCLVDVCILFFIVLLFKNIVLQACVRITPQESTCD